MGSSANSQLPTQTDEERNCTYAMQLMSSSVLPLVLHSTVQLEVFEILANAGADTQLSASQIVCHMPSCKNPDAATTLDRMLYVLASSSLLTCSIVDEKGVPIRLYGLSPVGKFFVRDEDGASMGPLLALMHDKVFINSWFELKDAVLEGGVPFDRVYGVHAFEYPKSDPRFNDVFNKAMLNHTIIVMKKILDNYKGFEHLKTLVDVGGGLGINLKMIISKYPTIKGTNLDLLHVVEHASSYPGGLEHVGGDMFESVPEGEAIFMKWILHDWSDGHCLKLLKNCYKALPDNGIVIVVEAILPVKPDTDSSVVGVTQLDLMMMVQNPGGKERSEHEFLALATEAGFKGIKLICCVCNFWVMEFYK